MVPLQDNPYLVGFLYRVERNAAAYHTVAWKVIICLSANFIKIYMAVSQNLANPYILF